jgi:hypothetical protein
MTFGVTCYKYLNEGKCATNFWMKENVLQIFEWRNMLDLCVWRSDSADSKLNCIMFHMLDSAITVVWTVLALFLFWNVLDRERESVCVCVFVCVCGPCTWSKIQFNNCILLTHAEKYTVEKSLSAPSEPSVLHTCTNLPSKQIRVILTSALKKVCMQMVALLR